MLKKRLIGVITVRQGIAVQSFGYKRYLPLGRAEFLAENLDRWGVDEILLQVIDRNGLGPDTELVKRISEQGIATPLTYGGGIRTADQAADVIHSGAERVTVDALLHDAPDSIASIAQRIGAQAVIAAFPVSGNSVHCGWLDYRSGNSRPIPAHVRDLVISGAVSEILVMDADNEGSEGGFSVDKLGLLATFGLPMIVFGGVTDSVTQRQLLARPDVVAIAIGNSLTHSEHAIQTVKLELSQANIRSVHFDTGVGGWL